MRIVSLALVFLLPGVSFSRAETLTCTSVITSNSIILSNGEKVRLIGVVTPETEHPGKPGAYFAQQARAFTKKMVEGKGVRLAYDEQQRDQYGRQLAYVYLENETLLNAIIIREGYGYAETRLPYSYRKEFKEYEEEARNHARGVWAHKPPPQKPEYIREFYMGSKHATIYHLPHCRLIRKVNPLDRRMFNSVNDAVTAGYLPCKICKPPYHK